MKVNGSDRDAGRGRVTDLRANVTILRSADDEKPLVSSASAPRGAIFL
jgi:hypothetical protein